MLATQAAPIQQQQIGGGGGSHYYQHTTTKRVADNIKPEGLVVDSCNINVAPIGPSCDHCKIKKVRTFAGGVGGGGSGVCLIIVCSVCM